MGTKTEIEFPSLAAADFECFREKARAFLRKHEDHPTIRKVRENERLTPTTSRPWNAFSWKLAEAPPKTSARPANPAEASVSSSAPWPAWTE